MEKRSWLSLGTGRRDSESKRSEIGSVVSVRKLNVLALSETNVKDKGECNFGRVVGKVSGVVNGHARERVGLVFEQEGLG